MTRSLSIGLVLLVLLIGSIASVRAADAAATPTAKAPANLLQAWLAFPQLARVAGPYAYIRVRSTQASEDRERGDLFKEFKRLLWRLNDDGYPRYVATIKTWRSHLRQRRVYRVPGTWTPAWLMSHPDQNPPIKRIQALGTCRVPTWVQVWDDRGVRNVPWHAGLYLSDLLHIAPGLKHDVDDEVAVVAPNGHTDHYGIAAWNFADTELAPGTRVVATLPLSGAAFPWIRDTIADLLAHSPSGVRCRELTLAPESAHG